MVQRKLNPKTSWIRKPNTAAGQRVGNKYNFSQVLKKTGDFIETHPMTREEFYKIRYAAYIWAYRKNCRIKTETKYYPEDLYGLVIEVVSHKRSG